MRTENWDHIRYFLAVARAGGLTGASNEVKASPSTISRHIEDFEMDIGVTLFTRDRTGYQLTEAGKRLYELAEGVAEGTRAFFDRASSDDGVPRGIVRLATTENFANYIILPQLGPFLKENPELDIELATGMSTVNVSRLEVEIAIRNVRPETGNVVIKRLGYQAFCRYGPVPSNSCEKTIGWISERDEFFVPAALSRSATIEKAQLSTSSLYSQVVAARHGMGAAILPCFIGDQEPDLVREGDIIEELQQDLWLVYHENLSGSLRVRSTLDFLNDLVVNNRDLLEGRGAT